MKMFCGKKPKDEVDRIKKELAEAKQRISILEEDLSRVSRLEMQDQCMNDISWAREALIYARELCNGNDAYIRGITYSSALVKLKDIGRVLGHLTKRDLIKIYYGQDPH